MKKLLILLSFILFGLGYAQAQTPTLDQYGGRTDINCATTLPYFHLEKIGVRWYFCTPSGHAFISMSMAGISGNTGNDCNKQPTQPQEIAKYGTINYNWGWQTIKRLESWSFNSIGQDSVSHVLPYDTCTVGAANCPWPGGKQPLPMPYVVEPKPAENALTNANGYLPSAVKDLIAGTNQHYNGWRGGSLPDVFDPNLRLQWTRMLQPNPQQPTITAIRANDPYLLGVLTDDSDFFTGSGSTPDFANGHTGPNPAFITLITAPVQTYIKTTSSKGKTLVYPVTKSFSKTLATNPTIACDTTNPCSLRDYLWQKYKTIAALNAAWGSNYTTFDSTGTQVLGEAIGTTDGATKTFTHVLAHRSVEPFSVLISVKGVPRIGDCPRFHGGCGGITTGNNGTLGSPAGNWINQTTSTVNYLTGAVTINFTNPPATGQAIVVSYIYGGWMSGGTGLMDEDGSHTAWVGTNIFCLEGPDPNYPAYFACNGQLGVPNHALPNANPNLGADLDNWIAQFSGKFFKVMSDGLRAVSRIPYLGLDVVGAWGAPAYSKFLQGAAPYVDAGFLGNAGRYWVATDAEFLARYQYTTRYLGDKPYMIFGSPLAQGDSSMFCFPKPVAGIELPTQAARGQAWYDMVNYYLTTPGFNGTYPVVGFNWWAWIDSQGLNLGIVSVHDNAYDGKEAVQAQVPCDPTYNVLSGAMCGGEATNYGDAITPVAAANQLWLK